MKLTSRTSLISLSRTLAVATVVGGIFLAGNIAIADVRTFRSGVNGYSGAVDTYVRQDQATTSFGAATNVLVDSSVPLAHGLIRFDQIFGAGVDQIPSGATIESATLTLRTSNDGDELRFHRMLVDWSGSSTWNSLSNGVSTNDVEARSVADVSFLPAAPTPRVDALNVTAALQAWASGASNYGWAILPTAANGWQFDSSDHATVANRPLLSVTFFGSVVITNQPVSQTAPPGTAITFNAGAAGLPPLYFQWRKNGSAIPGATNAAHWLNSISAADEGEYSVVVSNSFSSAISSNATLAIGTNAVIIVVQPTNQSVVLGTNAVLAAAVTGTFPRLQWLKNGAVVSGATNETLIIAPVTLNEAGFYALVASNAVGSVTSRVVELYVITPQQPAGTVLSFTNLWRYQLTLTDLGTAWRGTNFSDSGWPQGSGVFFSSQAAYPEPTNTFLPIYQNPPFNQYYTYYFRTRFTRLGTNSKALLIFTNLLDDGAVFYLNGVELFRTRLAAGPVGYSTFASSAPGNGTFYETVAVPVNDLRPGENLLAVEVHQSGSGSSDIAFGTRLKLISANHEPPVVVAQPRDITVAEGYAARLQGEVFGSAPMTFQWFKDGALLAGATNATLAFAAATPGKAGTYALEASNRFSTVRSSNAVLTVTPPVNPPVNLSRGPYLQNGTTNSVVLRWRTTDFAQSRVFFGTNENDLNFLAVDAVLKTQHELTLTNLQPDTRYYYSVWTGFSNLAGGAGFTFLTPPASARPTRIWVQGDSGTRSLAARAVVDAFLAFNGGPPDVWLMLGDNAYNSGTDAEYQQALFNFMPDMLRQTLLWTTIGNHETYSASQPGPFPYLDIFSPPTMGEAGGVPSGTKYYYSFDYGNIHFVSLDSEESSRSTNGAMAQWLQEDLAANTKDWLIAFWHSPPYTKGSHNSDNTADSAGRMMQMRENLLPILEAHGVDLVLNGHSHCYERSFLLDGHYGFSWSLNSAMLRDAGDGREGGTGAYRKLNSGPAPNEGAIYVVAGSSGQATFGTLNHPVMQVSLLEMGSFVIDVNHNRLDALFLRENGAVRDHFTVVKGVAPESLRVSTFRLAGEKVYGTWKSIAGRSYQVEASSAVTGAPWVPMGDAVLATGATSFWTNDIVAGASVFYQVRDVTP